MPQPVSTSALRLHSFRALQPGPRLIVTGAVHGNEVCGSRAIERVAREFDSGALVLQRGSLTLLPVTNPLAYERGQRNGDRNLNRNLYPTAEPQDYEDRIANVLCPLLAEHDVLLDLHSFQSPGEPFVMLGPQDNTGTLEPFAHAAREQALALRLGPRRIVEGWLATYADGVRRRLARTPAQDRAGLLSTDPRYGVGTTETMRSQGGFALTLECGQHQDPAAPEVAWRAIHRTLAQLQMIDAPAPEPVTRPQLLRLTMVIDKLHADDRFSRAWASYDPVREGETIGQRHDGTLVQADRDGFIVFPNPGATPGNEWFYFAQASTRDLGP
ncbi:MAG: succinylglutamate desuccinylase/aspartoacylase family protein [Rhodoferax sp.]|jgi:succinylglutamate desuccinylase|nr:succinylglutamate desuccinylase/aspartoacylase family protein [Rhodoferax sp.]